MGCGWTRRSRETAAGHQPGIRSAGHPGRRASAGRPGELPASQQVVVQVVDGLLAVGADVGYEPVPGCGDAGLLRHLLRQPVQAPDERGVLFRHRVGRRDVLFRDDQHVHRGLGPDVPERKQVVGLGDFVRRQLSLDDFAEDAIAQSSHLRA